MRGWDACLRRTTAGERATPGRRRRVCCRAAQFLLVGVGRVRCAKKFHGVGAASERVEMISTRLGTGPTRVGAGSRRAEAGAERVESGRERVESGRERVEAGAERSGAGSGAWFGVFEGCKGAAAG